MFEKDYFSAIFMEWRNLYQHLLIHKPGSDCSGIEKSPLKWNFLFPHEFHEALSFHFEIFYIAPPQLLELT